MTEGLIFILIISVLILGLFVLLRNPKQAVNIWFFLFSISIGIWVFANYFGSVVESDNLAVILVKTDFAFGVVLADIFLILSLAFTKKYKPYILLTFIPTVALMLLVYTNKLLTIQPVADGVKVTGSAIEPLYEALLAGYLLAGIIILVISRRKSRGQEKTQIGIVLYGLFIAALFVSVANLIIPQIITDVSIHTKIQHIAYLGFVALTGLMAYAIIKHRLFDIRLVVARTFAYTLLLLSLAGMYALVVFGASAVLFESNNISFGQTLLNIAVAIVLAFTFQPLRRFFEKVTDKIFYRDKYDTQTLLNDIGHVLSSQIDLHRLSSDVLQILSTQLRVSKIDLMVLDEGRLFFEAHTKRLNRTRPDINSLEILGKNIILTDNLEQNEQKEILQKYDFSVSVPLSSSDEFIGYLLIGNKLSGDIFNDTDVRVLHILANELAVAIQNAKSYTEIQHFNETLQVKIANATKQLRIANTHLKEMDNVKDEFISMASHQLGTPLTVIDGYISMITKGIYGKLDEKQKEPLSEALNRVRLMKRLVADLLNVSRMEAGRFFIDATPVDFNEVVPEEVEQLQGRAKEKQVKLEYIKPSKPLPIINFDEQKTRQAMMNLVDNAIFYTPKGNVKVYLESNSQWVIFRVVDNGIGVPEAQKSKLFSKFFRADNAKTERPNGTGIGLYLVKRVVEDQGGSIIFESQQGKGSTFGFKLPLIGTKSSSQNDPPTNGNSETIQHSPSEPSNTTKTQSGIQTKVEVNSASH